MNQAYRMRKSACFLKSGGKLTCSSCHDPHSVLRAEAAVSYYRAKCVACHPSVGVSGHPVLATSDCRTCHMPRRRAEDAVHTVMTDHLVQRRRPERDLLAPLKERTERYTGVLVVYYPQNLNSRGRDLYLGAALGQRGIGLMEKSTDSSIAGPGSRRARGGISRSGDSDRAIQEFRTALDQNAQLRKARYNLAQAYEAAGQFKEAIAEYSAVLSGKRLFAEAEFAVANVMARTGDRRGAQVHYTAAVIARPFYAEAHNNLGNLYADDGNWTRRRSASSRHCESIRRMRRRTTVWRENSPMRQQMRPALEHASRAVALKPDFAGARFNYGQLLEATGSTARRYG